MPHKIEFHIKKRYNNQVWQGKWGDIIKKFTIKGEYITLTQFLKEESVISSGGQAKCYLKENPVKLNGELEDRRGKKIHAGDVLNLAGEEYEFVSE